MIRENKGGISMNKKELEEKIAILVQNWDADTSVKWWNQLCNEMGWEEQIISQVGDSLDEYYLESNPNRTSYDIYELGVDDGEITDWLVEEIYNGYKKFEDLDVF